MEKQVLSIEQMQELQELGIDTSKASMFWYAHCISYSGKEVIPSDYCLYTKGLHKLNNLENERIIPTFTLQDILTILPNEIQNHKLESDLNGYIHYIFRGRYKVHNLIAIECDTMLEAAVNMLKWCKQNNYI